MSISALSVVRYALSVFARFERLLVFVFVRLVVGFVREPVGPLSLLSVLWADFRFDIIRMRGFSWAP